MTIRGMAATVVSNAVTLAVLALPARAVSNAVTLDASALPAIWLVRAAVSAAKRLSKAPISPSRAEKFSLISWS